MPIIIFFLQGMFLETFLKKCRNIPCEIQELPQKVPETVLKNAEQQHQQQKKQRGF